MGSLGKDAIPSIEVQDQPIGKHRRIRVVCVGAGYSGLMMAVVHTQVMKEHNVDFQIYEANEDLGGTWLVNRYPGCKCDIPAHNYAYSFAPNPYWKNYYATAREIHEYMKDVAVQHDCEQYITYNHRVTSAVWDDGLARWVLRVQNGSEEFTTDCDVLINAGGVLSSWNWPKIPGLDKFKGTLLHTARWDESYDWKDKKVAVIGIGSSGIQVVPQVAQTARRVDFHVRSSTWIVPGPGALAPTADDPAMDDEYNYAEAEMERFARDPEYLRRHRSILANKRIESFKEQMLYPEEQPFVDERMREHMRSRLGKSQKAQEVARWLLPDFPVGCRRLTPGPGFLEALTQDNVDSFWNDVDHVDETGVVSKDGTHRELDAIFCATGFDTDFKPRFPVVGSRGVDLGTKWTQNDPEAYWGTTIPDMPNFFTFIGPNSPVSNGSLVQAIQMQGIYIYKCITKLQTQWYRSMEIRASAVRDYNDYIQAWLSRTVWTAPCRSWYKRGTTDGKVVALYGGSCYHWAEALREPRWEDYHFEALRGPGQNKFSWLGNGFTKREMEGGSIADTQTLNFKEYFDHMVLEELHY